MEDDQSLINQGFSLRGCGWGNCSVHRFRAIEKSSPLEACTLELEQCQVEKFKIRVIYDSGKQDYVDLEEKDIDEMEAILDRDYILISDQGCESLDDDQDEDFLLNDQQGGHDPQ